MNLTFHMQSAVARVGLSLLKASGAYEGYWRHWRGDLFDAAERRGLHVMPAHYYSPVPKVSTLKTQLWDRRESVPGIDLAVPRALSLLQSLAAEFGEEFAGFSSAKNADRRKFTLANSGYGPGDAEIYYAMLRRFKPARVIEIGCGNSTLVASLAIQKNGVEAPDKSRRYICIEPYLPAYLTPPPAGVSEVIEKGVQEAPLALFDELESGDILFIDSTHVAALGSDVLYEYLEILPRLQPGVIIHIHDIFLPLEYPEPWAREQRFFWNEQYVLQAFLLHNDAYEVLMPSHALYALCRDDMTAAIPSLDPDAGYARTGPSSFWMRKKAQAAAHSQ